MHTSRSFGWVCLLACVLACSSATTPATQILIDIDAEPGVVAQADRLRVEVHASPDDTLAGLEERRVLDLTPGVSDPGYPFRIALAPDAGHEAWTFVVTATAMNGEETVAFARIVTSYVAGQTKYARLVIEDSCIVTLSCDPDETCHEGACRDARVDPNTLPNTPVTSDGGVSSVCTEHSMCLDNNACNGAERCDPTDPAANADGCVAGTPVECADDVACTSDTCAPSTGLCLHTAPDLDEDGHGDALCVDANGDALGDDCDDTDAARSPGNVEVCDARVDEDCDPVTVGYTDDDGDGAIDSACCNVDDEGVSHCGLDCDDTDLAVHSKQPEFCDDKDNDCDEETDEVDNAIEWFADLDMDGFGAGAAITVSCTAQPGRSLLATDCDDDNAALNPGTPEVCDDTDNNCNQVSDELLVACATSPDPDDAPPINECVNGLDDCSVSARCTDETDGFTCTCPSGTTGSGRGDDDCVDDDDCMVGVNGGCDTEPMAACENQVAAPRTCDCPANYSGDGVGDDGCVLGDPCLTDNGGCGDPSYRRCEYVVGGEPVCTDIDLCAIDNGGCSTMPRATCFQDAGTITCTCTNGYMTTDSGVTCTDINDCMPDNGGCGATSAWLCMNNTGAPRTCLDRDECVLNTDTCDTNATCTNTAGGFTCACNSGFTGNGFTCVVSANNECLSNMDNCDDQPDACVDDATGFHCACGSGFFGNGVGNNGCTACTAVANCQSGVTCTTNSNQRCATCAAGYVGDGTGVCTPCSLGTYDNNNVCVDCGTITNCSATETCNPGNGSNLVCPTCAAGFRGNGTGSCTACSAIANCASGLTCTNGSNQVCGVCAAGFVGDGTGTCTPCGAGTYDSNNTCVDCGTINNCAVTETCNVTTGNGDLCPTCSTGYFGSGTGACTACTQIANCASVETCTTNNNQVCGTCATGFVGDGTGSCTPCSAGTYDNNDACTGCTPIANCQSGLTCTNGGNQTCGTCASGYAGNGTTACTNINECLAGTDDCTDGPPTATCSDSNGSFSCVCPGGTTGMGHGAGGCVCNAVAACDSSGEMNGSYCSGNTLVTCAVSGSGCQTSTVNNCANVANEGCVGSHPNARCEVAFGDSTDDGSASNLGADFLYATPVVITQSITITRLGLMSRSAGSGVRMAIYTNSGNAPDQWRASALVGTVASGRNEFAITSPPPLTTPVTLAPGTYWVVAVVQSTISLAQGATGSVRYRSWSPWNTAFPNPGPLTGTTADTLPVPNFYVVGVP